MEVDLAVLADGANVSREGKLNILGIFNRFSLDSFPAATPSFVIVIRLAAHPSEAGDHLLTLRLADADGQEIAKLDAEFQVQRKRTSRHLRANVIVSAQMTIPAPGEYTFDILIDKRWERSLPVSARQVSS